MRKLEARVVRVRVFMSFYASYVHDARVTRAMCSLREARAPCLTFVRDMPVSRDDTPP